MHREPRNDTIDKIVLHVNVGPEVEGGARGLASYLNQIEGGYHKIDDDKEEVTTAGDEQLVWGASGMNRHGLHVCIIGYADQTADQWNDTYSTAAMKNAARTCANWCKAYGIPAVKLTPLQVATGGVKGICGHKDVEISGLPGTGGASGHYDPGPNFPWGAFVALVQQAISPAPPAPKVKPMYDPPIAADLGFAAVWTHDVTIEGSKRTVVLAAVAPNGDVYAWGVPYRKWPNQHADFAGRRAAQIGQAKGLPFGRYTITATNGDKYTP